MTDSLNTENNVVSFYRNECMEQPQRLRDVFAAYASDKQIRHEVSRLRKAVSRNLPLLWLGMGASFYSSWAGAIRAASLGRASFALEASEWLHFASGVRGQIAGPILVTTSGQSAELVELCRRTVKVPHILVCNNSESPCWATAEIRLPILAGDERANATKTYVNSTAVCTIIASELAGHPWQTEVESSVTSFNKTLENTFAQRNEIEKFCRGAVSTEVIGRGPSLAGAMMGALCVREMTGIRATAHSGGGFRHGPLFDVDSTHVAIVLALGRTAELGLRLAKDCVARGGRAVLVYSGPFEASERLLHVQAQPVPEPWESLTSVLVSQALTLALIERSGSTYVRIQTTTQ